MKKVILILSILVIMAFPLVVNAETPYVLRDGFSYPVVSSDMPYRVVTAGPTFYNYIVSTQPLLVERMLLSAGQTFIIHTNNALSREYLIHHGRTTLIYAGTRLTSRRLGPWMDSNTDINYSSHDLVLFRDEHVTIPVESRTVFFSAPPQPQLPLLRSEMFLPFLGLITSSIVSPVGSGILLMALLLSVILLVKLVRQYLTL